MVVLLQNKREEYLNLLGNVVTPPKNNAVTRYRYRFSKNNAVTIKVTEKK